MWFICVWVFISQVLERKRGVVENGRISFDQMLFTAFTPLDGQILVHDFFRPFFSN